MREVRTLFFLLNSQNICCSLRYICCGTTTMTVLAKHSCVLRSVSHRIRMFSSNAASNPSDPTKSKMTSSLDKIKLRVAASELSRPRILLVSQTGDNLGEFASFEACKLAEDKGLKLFPLKIRTKPWPTYKMLSEEEFNTEIEKKQEQEKRLANTKLFKFRSSIQGHDLGRKIKQIHQWLEKDDNLVKVHIQASKGDDFWEKQMKIVNKIVEGKEEEITIKGKPTKPLNPNALSITFMPASSKK